jgi:hypothetical protein
MATLYAALLAIGVLKFFVTLLSVLVRLSAPLSCSTTVVFASKPVTVALTFAALLPQPIVILITGELATVPLPFVTAQLGPEEGWVRTVTA